MHMTHELILGLTLAECALALCLIAAGLVVGWAFRDWQYQRAQRQERLSVRLRNPTTGEMQEAIVRVDELRIAGGQQEFQSSPQAAKASRHEWKDVTDSPPSFARTPGPAKKP